MTAELIRLVSLSKIGPNGLLIIVRATSEECVVLAVRMGIPAVRSLECCFNLVADEEGATIYAHGRLRAVATRVCVVSVEDFETLIEDEFDICFVPAGSERDDPDPDLVDEMPYEGGSIDLGEAIAQQLALVLDPYPKMDGAVVPAAGDEPNASPFSRLLPRANHHKNGQ
jgi:hypothetical protein